MPIKRRLFITDKNGVEHEIFSQEQLQRILNEMTPQQRKQWEDNYRFCPITNRTGIPDYTGTSWDLL